MFRCIYFRHSSAAALQGSCRRRPGQGAARCASVPAALSRAEEDVARLRRLVLQDEHRGLPSDDALQQQVWPKP